MKAILVKDEYSDITLECEYDIDRIYSDGHIKLTNSQRRYKAECFIFMNKGKKISYREAYRLQQLEKVKKKLGIY